VKFSIFYFSGTGNTRWVVQQLNKIIIDKGHQGELFTLDNLDMKDDLLIDILLGSDYIGIAHPIYGANIPPIVRTFITRIKNLLANEKRYEKLMFVISTFGYVNGFGPIAEKKLLSDTGFKLISYLNIRIFNNISTPKIKSKEISRVILEKRKRNAKRKMVKMVERVITRRRYINGIGPYLIPGIIIREIAKKRIENHYKTLSVNLDSCNQCMMCGDNCPTSSIVFECNQFKFLSTCTACTRCYNFCPTYSIEIDGILADPNIYRRHHGLDT